LAAHQAALTTLSYLVAVAAAVEAAAVVVVA
jgi:hypothetical protein